MRFSRDSRYEQLIELLAEIEVRDPVACTDEASLALCVYSPESEYLPRAAQHREANPRRASPSPAP